VSKPITIPIKKHTKVRRPKSRWGLLLTPTDNFYKAKPFIDKGDPVVVQDIKKVHKVSTAGFAEKMSSIMDEAIAKQQKGDWNEWHKDMEEHLLYNPPRYSLLTKLKNRFKK